MIFRISGKAGAVKERRGTSGEGDSKREWVMRTQPVVVNEFVQTEVSLGDDQEPFRVGEDVDAIVDVYVSKGYLRTELRGDWPESPASRHAGRPLSAASGA